MARRRVMNRQELRANYDAAERREKTPEDVEEEEVEDEEDDEEEDDAEAEADDEAGDEDEAEEEEAPKKPKKKAPAKAKPRTRAVKVIRMRVVWGVFNNSNQRVATYDYARKADAEAHAAKLSTDKKVTHFIQPIKEAIEEKKEA